ncbi:MAG TPA: hypothetical protein VGB26_12400 [Nitrospiria bacterium]
MIRAHFAPLVYWEAMRRCTTWNSRKFLTIALFGLTRWAKMTGAFFRILIFNFHANPSDFPFDLGDLAGGE